MSPNQAAWLDGPQIPMRIDKLEMPKSEPHRIVVRNHAAAVNPIDWKIQERGVLFDKSWPMVMGVDLAGEVIDVGEGVKHIKKGDRVMAHGDNQITHNPTSGCFALYTSAPASTSAVVPPSISYAEASVLPLAFDTAATGFYRPYSEGYLGLPYPSLKPMQSTKTIVVWGGSASVGAVGIQLAILSGVKVIAVSSSRNFDFCRKCGAAEVYDYTSPTVVDDVVSAVQSSGHSFAGVYDAISMPESYRYVFEIVRRLGGGNVATVLKPPPEVPDKVKIGHIYAVDPVTHPLWTNFITEALESGVLKCLPEPLIIGHSLESVQEGLDLNKKGVSAKKVVIELQ